MKKYLVLFLIFSFLAGCATDTSSSSSTATEPVETPSTTISITEPNFLPIAAKEYAMHFDMETNQHHKFQNLELDVPNNWWLYEQDNEFMFWLPEYDSETEYAQIYLLVLGHQGYSQGDLYSSDLQNKIQGVVEERFLEGITNTMQVDSCTGKANIEYYLYSLSGVHKTEPKDVTVNITTYSFVIGQKLYMILHQSSTEDSYDYSHDVISTISSIKPMQVTIHIVEEPAVEETYSNTLDSSTSNINVRFISDTIDNNRLHLKVFTENNSEEIFSGHIYVVFYSADGEDYLGSDTIFVDSLNPGQESWANITIDAYLGTPKMVVDFSNVKFFPLEEIHSELDSDVSQKVAHSYELNFDGVSWYNDITKIEVYSDGNCIVTIKNNAKNGGQFYANAIKQCGEQHGVTTVKVVDEAGNVKAVF